MRSTSLDLKSRSVLLAALWLAIGLNSVRAQSGFINAYTIAGGSGTGAGGAFVVSGTIGQPEATLALNGGAYSLIGGFWARATGTPAAAPLIVPGKANPWLAGRPDGFVEANGDVAPDESPVLFTNFTGGARLQFAASGSANYGGAPCGPAGIAGFLVNHPNEDGIGAIVNSLADALIGVFLEDAPPDLTAPTPVPLDFGTAESLNYVVLQPALKQPFYIGSGTNSSGLQQTIIAPASATRLFLGIQDGFGWYNNSGSFTVVVQPAALSPPPVKVVNAFGTNLILNPGAELGAGSVSGNDILTVPNWTTTNNFTAVVYDSSFFGSATPEFGLHYFSGGPTTRADAINPFSSATQLIDVSAFSSAIDAATVLAELSGYFGGYGEQNDHAALTASYLDVSGNSLGEASVGNVLAIDRTNRTTLLYRGETNAVPVGTRSIQVVLGMTNEAGAYYDDGYADNLSLVLRQTESASTTIFDNTSGTDNGGFGVAGSTWLASKLCLGSQPYQLDSLSLLLTNCAKTFVTREGG